jgi:hypothetical protein
MEAPQRKSEGKRQQKKCEHPPGKAVVGAFGLDPALRHVIRQSGEDWSFLKGSFGNNRCAGGDEIGNGLVFVEFEVTGVGADKPLIKDTAGELIELVRLEGDKEARGDFGGDGDVVKRDFALFPLPLQSCSKGFQLGPSPAAFNVSGRIQDK